MSNYLENKTSLFIEKAIKKHGDKYDYSRVEYKGSHSKVWIICPEHEMFEQTPTGHLTGNGCPRCAAKYSRGKYRLTTLETFLIQAFEIHQNKYDYSKVEWKNTRTKIIIICPIHGEFTQIPQNHIRLKCGCRKCGREIAKSKINKYNTDYFIENAIKFHGDKYDYSNSQCFNATDKVEIECPVHGMFPQPANQHLQGHGCPKCNFDQMANDRAMGKELFINKAKEKFGEKYDYSKVEYVNGQKYVCLICPIHGEFEVTPNNHLSKKSGCPICNESKLERALAFILDEQNVKYERQKKFNWLGKQSLDFYLPEFQLAIECQGKQHFDPVDFAGKGVEWANKALQDVIKRDNIKLKKCLEHNIEMIYVIDKDEYFDKKYHFNSVVPFSDNVSYKIVHINDFENYINHLVDVSHFLGL
jgi:very-short-patch-repair endonuclease